MASWIPKYQPGKSVLFGTPSSAGGGQAPFQPSLAATPTAFVYDHSTNAWSPAGLTGTTSLSTPGLIPIFGGDDGAVLLGASPSGVITYPSASALTGTGDFTIAALVSVGTDGSAIYISKQASSFTLFVGANSVTAGGDLSINVSANINDGRVHLYVLRRMSSFCELFIDGVRVGSQSSNTNDITGVGALTSEQSTGQGTIDEVAWWQRALTDTEIQELAQAASIRTGSTGLLSGQWLTRHLSDFAFSASDADISTGSSMIDAPDLSTGDAAGALAAIGAAEDGMVFIDGAGKLRLIGRNDIGPSVATIGDGGGTEIPFVEPPAWSLDIDHISNRVQVTKAGYATVTVNDTDSQNQYGIRTLTWDAGLLEASQMEDAANWFLARYKQPRLRIDQLQVRGQGGYWPTLLALELGDRITVNHRPPGGVLLTADVIVEHIEHQITEDDWVMVLQLAPIPSVWIWDESTWDGGDFWGWGPPATLPWHWDISTWSTNYVWS